MLWPSRLIEQRIHLLILDPFPPGSRDPNGNHSAIGLGLHGETFLLPEDKPLTLVVYEAGSSTRAYCETIAVGEVLPDKPLFLASEYHIPIPLEATYRAAWDTVPARWQRVVSPQTE